MELTLVKQTLLIQSLKWHSPSIHDCTPRSFRFQYIVCVYLEMFIVLTSNRKKDLHAKECFMNSLWRASLRHHFLTSLLCMFVAGNYQEECRRLAHYLDTSRKPANHTL